MKLISWGKLRLIKGTKLLELINKSVVIFKTTVGNAVMMGENEFEEYKKYKNNYYKLQHAIKLGLKIQDIEKLEILERVGEKQHE